MHVVLAVLAVLGHELVSQPVEITTEVSKRAFTGKNNRNHLPVCLEIHAATCGANGIVHKADRLGNLLLRVAQVLVC
jgi:hypothetical protein